MIKDYIQEYKSDIRAKYTLEKTGVHKGFLINPSPAKLRDLCILIFKENKNSDDLASFSFFFGFDFNEGNLNKLKKQTDKFKPLGTFLKGDTELSDLNGMDLVAVLINFQPRPINKYSKINHTENSFNKDIEVLKKEESVDVFEEIENKRILIQPKKEEIVKNDDFKTKNSFINKNKTKIVGGISLATLSFFLISKTVINDKQCMEWQKNHYEVVECENKSVGFATINSKIPLNENLLDLRKIEVSDKTTFFKHNKAIVWYYKNDDKLEFFNAPGFHPENDKPLKPITQYMIDKYVK
jgi:hypothetical protein